MPFFTPKKAALRLQKRQKWNKKALSEQGVRAYSVVYCKCWRVALVVRCGAGTCVLVQRVGFFGIDFAVVLFDYCHGLFGNLCILGSKWVHLFTGIGKMGNRACHRRRNTQCRNCAQQYWFFHALAFYLCDWFDVFILLPVVFLINSHQINVALTIKKSTQTITASASTSTMPLVRLDTKKTASPKWCPQKLKVSNETGLCDFLRIAAAFFFEPLFAQLLCCPTPNHVTPCICPISVF